MQPPPRFLLSAILLAACGGGAAVTRPGEAKGAAPTRDDEGLPKTLVSPDPSPTRVGGLLPSAASGRTCPAGMASLPGGTFKMGDRGDTVVEEGEHGEVTDTCEVLWAMNRARDPDAPRLFCTGGDTVTVQPFCLDVEEVTVDAYASCVRQGRCSAEHLGYSGADTAGLTTAKACNYGEDTKRNHPINCVDWVQASTYCRAQDERLPTEEEWEWAARGGASANKYPWGNAAPDKQLCWSGPRGLVTKRAGTCPVGSFPSGDAPGGIQDLAGNVWEWTSSSYDPSGPSPHSRVFRGGAWNGDDVPDFRAAARFYGGASTWRSFFVGFRCAL